MTVLLQSFTDIQGRARICNAEGCNLSQLIFEIDFVFYT